MNWQMSVLSDHGNNPRQVIHKYTYRLHTSLATHNEVEKRVREELGFVTFSYARLCHRLIKWALKHISPSELRRLVLESPIPNNTLKYYQERDHGKLVSVYNSETGEYELVRERKSK